MWTVIVKKKQQKGLEKLPPEVRALFILCAVENSTLDEQDCGLDFFDPTDRRYEYRMKEEQ